MSTLKYIANFNVIKGKEEYSTVNINIIKQEKSIKMKGVRNYQTIQQKMNKESTTKTNRRFQRIHQQREFMEELFYELKLQNFSEWLQISKETIKKKGGKTLLHFYYSNDLKKLFSNIYPNYPWNFYTYNKNIIKNNLNNLNNNINNEEEEFQIVIGNFGKLKEKLRGNIILQREVMNRIFFILKLNSIDEWKLIKKINFIQAAHSLHKKIIINNKINNKNMSIKRNQNIGKILLEIYSNNFNNLLKTIFPDHQWDFDNNNNNNNNNENNENNNNFTLEKINLSSTNLSIYQQRKLIDLLFIKLKLNNLEDWYDVTSFNFNQNNAQILLDIYLNNIPKLLQSIYPNFPWNFNYNLIRNFKSISNQRQFMDRLFDRLKLEKIDDWININPQSLYKFGAKHLISYYYSNDMKKLLTTIYPRHPWDFSLSIYNHNINNNNINDNNNNINNKLKDINYNNNENNIKHNLNINNEEEIKRKKEREEAHIKETHRKIMENIGVKLNLKSVEEWRKNINKSILIKYNANNLLQYYSNDIEKLLETIFPEYQWNFDENPLNSRSNFKSIESQQEFMDHLFSKLEMKCLDDWLKIDLHFFSKIGGKYLINNYYGNEMNSLLKIIYPYYCWSFVDAISIDQEFNDPNNLNYLSDNEKNIRIEQRKIMEKIYLKIGLNSLNDWLNVSKTQIILHGGNQILDYYSSDLKLMFSSIYPKHNWNFDQLFIRKNLILVKDQRKFMDNLFIKLKFKSLNDWLIFPLYSFYQLGGKILLSKYYQNDMIKLLKTIYPEHDWPKVDLKKVLKHRLIMDKIFKKLKLKSLDDWIGVKKSELIAHPGWVRLLEYYKYDLKNLLISIYPFHNWDFVNFKFRPYLKEKKNFSICNE